MSGDYMEDETKCEHGCRPNQCLACYLAEHDPRNPSRREIAVQFALKLAAEDGFTTDKDRVAADLDNMKRAVFLTDALLAELEKGKQ